MRLMSKNHNIIIIKEEILLILFSKAFINNIYIYYNITH